MVGREEATIVLFKCLLSSQIIAKHRKDYCEEERCVTKGKGIRHKYMRHKYVHVVNDDIKLKNVT